jgi:hypothetical protein
VSPAKAGVSTLPVRAIPIARRQVVAGLHTALEVIAILVVMLG